MKARIGYLIPEFPAQTYTWIWRERQALAELDIEADLISTRRPIKSIISHSWAEEAQKNTVYLIPFGIKDFVGALTEVIKAGPFAWMRCLAVIMKAQDASLIQKLRFLAMILVAGKLVWLGKTRGWSHVQVHSAADAANIAMFASILSILTYSVTLHGHLEDFGPNQKQKWGFAKFGTVITQELYDELTKCLAGYLPKKLEIAPMGVDSSAFTRKTSYSPWNGDGTCHIFSCGRLNPCKGHADLLAAVAQLRKQGINAELVIAGEDEQGGSGYRKDLEKLIQQLNLNDSVRLLGAVSEATVKENLEKAHIFALASPQEPLGVAIMEAMAMELPVVVIGGRGVKELVDDGIDGLLVEPNTPTQIAGAIVKLLEDKELSIKLGKAGREKVVKYFHPRRSAEVLLNSLNSIFPVKQSAQASSQ